MEHPERWFYFELAERLGCSVSELLERMPASEITEWMAYYSIRKKKHDLWEKEQQWLQKEVF